MGEDFPPMNGKPFNPQAPQGALPLDSAIMKAWEYHRQKYRINPASPAIGEIWWAFRCGWASAGGQFPKGFDRRV